MERRFRGQPFAFSELFYTINFILCAAIRTHLEPYFVCCCSFNAYERLKPGWISHNADVFHIDLCSIRNIATPTVTILIFLASNSSILFM